MQASPQPLNAEDGDHQVEPQVCTCIRTHNELLYVLIKVMQLYTGNSKVLN